MPPSSRTSRREIDLLGKSHVFLAKRDEKRPEENFSSGQEKARAATDIAAKSPENIVFGAITQIRFSTRVENARNLLLSGL